MSVNWEHLAKATRVEPGRDVHLAKDFDPGRSDPELGKDKGLAALSEAITEMAALQDKFYAQADRALLIVLQAIDAAGKDGTIKHVMSGVNPEGVDVFSFKSPSSTERAHDYLWRHQAGLPEVGRISIFNRSHYENVLVTRVHPEMLWPAPAAADPKGIWHRRYREINDWERYLTDNGTVIVKLFLNVSNEEQEKRFLERINNPAKNWKFSAADMHERTYWGDYQKAFEEMLSNTSTEWAPWHVIPADHKWFSHLSTSAVILRTLQHLDPQYPSIDDQQRQELAQAKQEMTGRATS